MNYITAEYLSPDEAHIASVKLKNSLPNINGIDTNIQPLNQNSYYNNLGSHFKKYTLLTTGMLGNTNVFITDPVITDVTEANIREDKLKSDVLLCVCCPDNLKNDVSGILTATGGEHVHIIG